MYKRFAEKNEVFAKAGKNRRECRNWGFIVEGEKAPEKCPVCSVAKAHFEIEAKNY